MPTARELLPLQRVVQEWGRLQKKYCKQVRDDGVFWHREEANSALLAAATWNLGGIAIVEHQGLRVREKSRRNGYIDIWLQTKGRRSPTFLVEAKQTWLTSTRRHRANSQRITDLLDEAVAAAKTCDAGPGERRVGLVYVLPKVDVADRTRLDDIHRAICEVSADMRTFVDMGFAKLRWPGRGRRYYFPSVYVLAKLVR